MEKQKAIAFSLSQEELFVIMSYLKAQTILGLDMVPFKKLTREILPVTLGVAERALIARGFLVPGDTERFDLIDPVHALVRSCTNPNQSVILQCQFLERAQEDSYFHIAKKIHVVHSIPMSGIHQFIGVQNLDELLKAIMSSMQLGKVERSNSVEARIAESLLTKARNAARKGGQAAAAKVLEAAGIDGKIIEGLSATLGKPALNHTIMHIYHDQDGRDRITGFALLGSEAGLWKLTPLETKSKEPKISVAPTSPEEILQTFKELMSVQGR